MPHGETQPTVLLIDDDPETRDLLGARLGESGFVVFTARGEADGAAMARAVRPAVILLEFGRRDSLDTLALGRRVREQAGLMPAPPLAIYASREDETAREGEAVEVAPGEYVVLPDDGDILATFLRGLTRLAA
jgi:two-component system OmpR family response regulator